MFPNSQRLNRGNYVMEQLVQACRANNVTDLIIIHEHRGEPGVCRLEPHDSLSVPSLRVPFQAFASLCGQLGNNWS